MKGAVVLQLNDDDSILIQAQVPIDADRAKVYHFAYPWSEIDLARAKCKEEAESIRKAYVSPVAESKIHTLQ
jgi:hypothetical protein